METCPDCDATLPEVATAGHRYIGASPSCWALYTSLLPAGFAAGVLGASVVDAYAAQHPGGDSPQAVQSAAIHLVTLHATLEHGLDPSMLVRMRVEGVEAGRRGDNRYVRLTRPRAWRWTIADVADGRASADEYVRSVYEAWMESASAQIVSWYDACRPLGR